MPTRGGVHNAILSGHAIGCTAVQVFTTSPQQWKSKPVTAEMVEDFKNAQAETAINHVVSHDSYLVNLAVADEARQKQSTEALVGEMDRCAAYGIRFVVSHIGAHTGQGEEVGLRRAAEGVLEVLAQTDDSVTLLAETTAGQGSCLNHQFEHIARLLELTCAPDRLAVCVDTCHIFAAGYDIRIQEGYEKTWEQFDHLVGIERIKVIHCNDSKKALGTRVDRHNHIGEGEIGPEAFRLLVNDPRWNEVPILIETPDADTMHAENLAKLWSYQGA